MLIGRSETAKCQNQQQPYMMATGVGGRATVAHSMAPDILCGRGARHVGKMNGALLD